MVEATLVYDDDCGFCTWWAEFLLDRADVRAVGFSELDDRPDLRGRLPEDYERCSHLLVDGEVHSCGASIEGALAHTDLGREFRPLVAFLRQFEDYERVRERAYRLRGAAGRERERGRGRSGRGGRRGRADDLSGRGRRRGHRHRRPAPVRPVRRSSVDTGRTYVPTRSRRHQRPVSARSSGDVNR